MPWAKPEDLAYDAALPATDPAWREPLNLGGLSPGGFQAIFVDGAVNFISDAVDSGLLRSLFTRQGGEVIDR